LRIPFASGSSARIVDATARRRADLPTCLERALLDSGPAGRSLAFLTFSSATFDPQRRLAESQLLSFRVDGRRSDGAAAVRDLDSNEPTMQTMFCRDIGAIWSGRLRQTVAPRAPRRLRREPLRPSALHGRCIFGWFAGGERAGTRVQV
jgi:hypothetical protein